LLTVNIGTDSLTVPRLSVGTVNVAGMIIDCDDCAVRGQACQDCVVSVLLGVPKTLRDDERAALEALAEAGLAPRLRLVPMHPRDDTGVA
jgi:hypothetical protein